MIVYIVLMYQTNMNTVMKYQSSIYSKMNNYDIPNKVTPTPKIPKIHDKPYISPYTLITTLQKQSIDYFISFYLI